MAKNNKKTLILNTLILLFCIVVIALYSLIPLKGKETKKFLLTFDSDGGTAVAALDIQECEIVAQPSNPTKEGYIFVGWELNGEPFDFTTEICGDMELKAVWEEMNPEKTYITIYLQYGEGEPSAVVVEEGTIPPMPQTPTRDGYNFVEWHVNGFFYGFDTPLEDGTVVEAVWEEIPAEPEPADDTEYTVRFNLNGGTAGGNCDDQTVKSGGTAKNVCKPTRDGYSLNGWSPRINSKITKDTTFVAQWKANQSSGGDSGGGSGGDTPTPPPATTYNISCTLEGENIPGGTTTNSSTSAAASTCASNTNSSTYPKALYNISYSCSTSGTNINCTGSASTKGFTVVCTHPAGGLSGTDTTKCKLSLTGGSGVTIVDRDDHSYTYAIGSTIFKSEFDAVDFSVCVSNKCIDASKKVS